MVGAARRGPLQGGAGVGTDLREEGILSSELMRTPSWERRPLPWEQRTVGGGVPMALPPPHLPEEVRQLPRHQEPRRTLCLVRVHGGTHRVNMVEIRAQKQEKHRPHHTVCRGQGEPGLPSLVWSPRGGGVIAPARLGDKRMLCCLPGTSRPRTGTVPLTPLSVCATRAGRTRPR